MLGTELQPIQQEISRELGAKNPKLAEMYLGALSVWSSNTNPDRLAFAAHGIREMLEGLSKFIDAPIPKKGPGLGDLTKKLSIEWERLKSISTWPGNPKWEGTIDQSLRTFLCAAEGFFLNSSRIPRTRAERATTIIRHHHVGNAAIPGKLEDHKSQEWLLFVDYFNRTAHHGSTTKEEFVGYLEGLEQLLINTLRPRTFESRKQILAIIEESESNAN